MKETDFPTKNCRSATKITQVKTAIEKPTAARRSWLKCPFTAPKSTL